MRKKLQRTFSRMTDGLETSEAMDGGVSGLHRDNFEVHEVSKEEFFESKKR
jgi:hypothetical protein